MRYLLDTCVISEVTKARPAAKVLTWLDVQDEMSLLLSVITLGEIQKGISKLPHQSETPTTPTLGLTRSSHAAFWVGFWSSTTRSRSAGGRPVAGLESAGTAVACARWVARGHSLGGWMHTGDTQYTPCRGHGAYYSSIRGPPDSRHDIACVSLCYPINGHILASRDTEKKQPLYASKRCGAWWVRWVHLTIPDILIRRCIPMSDVDQPVPPRFGRPQHPESLSYAAIPLPITKS